MSNFSFSHSVFKRLVLQTCQNQGLYGKGLMQIMVIWICFIYCIVFKITSVYFHLYCSSQCTYPYFHIFFQRFPERYSFNATGCFPTISLLTLYSIGFIYTHQQQTPFENIVGNEEITRNEWFLLFPQCFLYFPNQISVFESHLFCQLQMLWIWTSPDFWKSDTKTWVVSAMQQSPKKSQYFKVKPPPILKFFLCAWFTQSPLSSAMHSISTWEGLCHSGIKLTLSQTTNFRLFQTERVCRQQF